MVAVLEESVITLTAAQAAVVAGALADAWHYCQDLSAWCADCAAAPIGVCPDHLTEVDRAQAYGALAAELARITNTAGRDVPPPRPASEPLPHHRERT